MSTDHEVEQEMDGPHSPSALARKDEICACREGMFPIGGGSSRRQFLTLAASAVAVAGASPSLAAETPEVADSTPLPNMARELGSPVVGGYGVRSKFEKEARLTAFAPNEFAAGSFTPLAQVMGNLTPSGLHFERHHAGIPTIDPARHMLFVHGMTGVAKKYSMADIQRLPSVTRKYFIECSGNTAAEWRKPTLNTVQQTHGLFSTSEWTGVLFSTIARDTGLLKDAAWTLAEGADAALMTRSIPLEKLLSDGILAYGQNGEALRPEQGYPLRLIVPGFEGNTHIKWLRRLEISDKPYMTREETSKYTDPMADGKARQFTLIMDAKSVITFPSGDMKLPSRGFYVIGGFAWSGRGCIKSVEVSVDGGRNWQPANLESTPEPMCSVRFNFPWVWDGKPAILQSRCVDESGYQQPTLKDLIALRPSTGPQMSNYHLNAIQSWAIAPDGRVSNVHV